jgi:hypothetical protein
MDHFLHFYSLGLRSNPFRILTDEEWAAVAVVPPELDTWPHTGSPCLQILGERGFGKSTLLRALHDRCLRRGLRSAYEYLPPEQTRFLTAPQGLDVLFLDEAQRLTARERARLAAFPVEHLAFSSHADLAPIFAHRRRPVVTQLLGPVGPEQLGILIERRLRFFALADGPYMQFSAAALERLRLLSRGNPRAAERLLYELLQRLERPGVIGAEDIIK